MKELRKAAVARDWIAQQTAALAAKLQQEGYQIYFDNKSRDESKAKVKEWVVKNDGEKVPQGHVPKVSYVTSPIRPIHSIGTRGFP